MQSVPMGTWKASLLTGRGRPRMLELEPSAVQDFSDFNPRGGGCSASNGTYLPFSSIMEHWRSTRPAEATLGTLHWQPRFPPSSPSSTSLSLSLRSASASLPLVSATLAAACRGTYVVHPSGPSLPSPQIQIPWVALPLHFRLAFSTIFPTLLQPNRVSHPLPTKLI